MRPHQFVCMAVTLLSLGCGNRLTTQTHVVYICEEATGDDFSCKRHGPQGSAIESRLFRAILLITPWGNDNDDIVTLLVIPAADANAVRLDARITLASRGKSGDGHLFVASHARTPSVRYIAASRAGAEEVIGSWLNRFIVHPTLDAKRDPVIDICITVVLSDSSGNEIEETVCFVVAAEEITVPSSLV